MISQGIYTSASSPAMAPKMFVPEIVLKLPEEQANTISRVKLNKTGFYGFGLWFWLKTSSIKEEINIHKLIQN